MFVLTFLKEIELNMVGKFCVKLAVLFRDKNSTSGASLHLVVVLQTTETHSSVIMLKQPGTHLKMLTWPLYFPDIDRFQSLVHVPMAAKCDHSEYSNHI